MICCLDRLGLCLPGLLLFLACLHEIVGLSLREVAHDAVVIGLAERIELVIVAARATHRDAQKRRAHDIGHLGQHFVARAGDLLVARVLAQRPQPVEAAGDQIASSLLSASISSPASCSLTNSSYGLSSLKLWTT